MDDLDGRVALVTGASRGVGAATAVALAEAGCHVACAARSTRTEPQRTPGTLDETVAAFPGVEVGSYPHLDAADYRVKITLDGRDPAAVDRALAFLAERLGDAVAKTE